MATLYGNTHTRAHAHTQTHTHQQLDKCFAVWLVG